MRGMVIFERSAPLLELIIYLYSLYPGNCEEFTGNNLAEGKPAWQYPSEIYHHGTADKAVDGDTNPSYNGGRSCTHTPEYNNTIAYWTVDLGDQFYITGVRIYNRKMLQERLRLFRLYGYPGNVTLYDDANVQQYNNSIINVTLESSQLYRNLTVYLPIVDGEMTILTLCEVQIFGGCSVPAINGGNFSSTTELKTVVIAGTEIQANCFIGYELGNRGDKLICESNYTWKNPVPVCTAITCEPMTLGNGTYNYSQSSDSNNTYVYGSVATPECFKGFTLEGTRQRTCQENKTWSGGNTICTLITCEHPGTLKNGSFFQNNTEEYVNGSMPYNSIIYAICDLGYTLNFNENKMVCSEYGNWTVNSTYCDAVNCDDQHNICQTCGDERTWVGIVPSCQYRQGPESGPPIGLIAGVSVGVATVVLVFFLAVIIARKRRIPKNHETTTTNTEYVNSGITETIMSEPGLSLENGENGDDKTKDYYDFTTPRNFPENGILVENLAKVVFGGDSVSGFEGQFESLPKGLTKTHRVASKVENRPRNRYKNMFPYDDNRVILKARISSRNDYINASYINGFDQLRSYIATQGPMKNTLDDFWDMIWQAKCGKIVMLTNLMEKEKSKCEQYWPDSGSQKFGDVIVRMVDAEIFSEFVVRSLAMHKECQEERLVTLFHFTNWPDKGVPKYASSLVQFRNKVKHSESSETGPTVVHCSAGVGRTGTYIALDYLTDQAKALGYVTVVDCVRALRTQRVNLVQTLDQYIFVHHALVETLMLSTSALPAAKFPDAYRELLQMDPVTQKRNLTLAFEMLRKMSPVQDEYQYVTAKDIVNKKKNRYSNILPVAEYMPKLSGTGQQETDYINAVFLPTYKEKNAFIVTQLPLETTIQDFWRLVYEHDVHTIVMLNHVSQVKKKEIYWPEDNQTVVYGNNGIKHLTTENLGRHRAVRLKLSTMNKTRTIKQFQCGSWKPESTVPDVPSTILLLVELVQAWQQQSGNHPILVHCMNGAERSGLYCVISAVLERMKIEQDVAISQVIEEMRNCREQIISSEVQFQFCHEAVVAFLEQHDTYSNFTA